MRHKASFRAPKCKSISHSIQNQSKFSTTPHRGINQDPNYKPVSPPDHQAYTHLLAICLRNCKQIQSRQLFDEMPQRLQHASKSGKLIHAQSLQFGFASKGQLGNAIVDLYAKCGNVDFAEKAFARLEKKDTLACNSVLSMYSKREMFENVVKSFISMQIHGVLPNQFTNAIVLSVCGRVVDVGFGKQIHCNIIKMGFESNSFSEGSLIDMYTKCRNVVDARRILDSAEDPDTVSWTAMIAGYVQVGLPDEALRVFEDMQNQGRAPDHVAFVTAISACVGLGRLDDARHLFSQMPNPNAVAWNVMISGHAQRGYEVEAVVLFQNMMKAGVKATRSTLGTVFSAIASLANYGHGLQVHAQATKQGLDSNVYVGSSLINMYAKCQKMEAAEEVFNALDEKNGVLLNAMLGGYAQNGYAFQVVNLFMATRDCGFFQPDEYTCTSVLSACAGLKSIEMGRQLHSFIIKKKFQSNLFAANALVDMYAKSGSLYDARQQFELIRNRDNVSWNAIIVGYVQEEEEEEAFYMFKRMRLEGISPDEVSLASILSACANIQSLDKGKQLHSILVKYGLERSLYTGSSLVDMYAKCGTTWAAGEVFSCMNELSVASTNALIAGYAQTNTEKAVCIFKYMLSEGMNPSEVTFASLLDACRGPSTLDLGRQIHCLLLKVGLSYHGEFLAVSLLGMYINSQEKEGANVLFSELPNPKSTVLWTVVISGHTQNDCSEDALLMYREMRNYNAMPDQATFVSVLRACAVLASLQDGREIHTLIFHTSFDSDELTCSALIDMYAKCGDVSSSAQVFGEMVHKKDVILWNSMIVGLAKNGYAENALKIFDEMKQAHIKPDEVTFLGVLTACSHAGRVSEGRLIFDTMTSHFEIQPRVDHCACMIDLLGRWGFLKEAEELIEKLELEPHAMIWATYLGACKLHGDDIRGKHAAEKLIELEPEISSPYVLLSNIYAASGNWDGVNSVRRAMKEKGVKKFPGGSWIVLDQKTNFFVACDKSHPIAGKIHAVLNDLTTLMKDEGYDAENE
ncbi:hypothetical protein RJ640_006737 [Escallonia rubra]|uniref:Chlororespiratory reduction 21 n=1 Tax=Escallonia rubra TaxID=112253 RepID=A0AA88UKH4_9ASTE|nr:hypothetical protein RJ640_006737 [Escallonia rubra]